MKRVADTLETIAVGEAAATKEKLEDKVEAGDVILKSLIDGLEDRASQRFDKLENELSEVKSTVKDILQGIEVIMESQQTTSKILTVFVDRFQKHESMIDLLKHQTAELRRRLDNLDAS